MVTITLLEIMGLRVGVFGLCSQNSFSKGPNSRKIWTDFCITTGFGSIWVVSFVVMLWRFRQVCCYTHQVVYYSDKQHTTICKMIFIRNKAKYIYINRNNETPPIIWRQILKERRDCINIMRVSVGVSYTSQIFLSGPYNLSTNT